MEEAKDKILFSFSEFLTLANKNLKKKKKVCLGVLVNIWAINEKNHHHVVWPSTMTLSSLKKYWLEWDLDINYFDCFWRLLWSVFTWDFDVLFYLSTSIHFASIHLIYALEELTTESKFRERCNYCPAKPGFSRGLTQFSALIDWVNFLLTLEQRLSFMSLTVFAISSVVSPLVKDLQEEPQDCVFYSWSS